MKFYFNRFVLCLTAFLTPVISFALSPLVQYNDLVAGEGEHGFEDGPFYSAQFNNPIGLALNDDGSVLYVVDCDNNRVRSIDLNHKNEVGTIAGTGAAGNQNGLLPAATFNHPTELAYLGDGKLAVNDAGNNLIRLIDLKTNKVSTLAGGGKSDEDGEALTARLSGVWGLAYLKADNCLFFSEPETGKIKELNLKTGNIDTILKNDTSISRPAALCVVGENLYVADRDSGKIYKMSLIPSPKDNPKVKTSLSLVEGRPGGQKNVALAGFGTCLYGSGGSSLYAYNSDPVSQISPINRIYPDDVGPITFVSAWGEVIAQPATVLPQFAGVAPGQRVGFIADPRSEGRFYVTNPANCVVASFRDLNFRNALGAGQIGMTREFTYPHKKPFNTYRILLCGRSVLMMQRDRQWGVIGKSETVQSENIMTLMSKRLEFDLNTMAALEDAPLHFEIFNDGQIVDSLPYIWTYYDAPKIIEDYDIDLTITFVTPFDSFQPYYQTEMTPEGIPKEWNEPKYASNPNMENFKSGSLHDLAELVREKKMDITAGGWNQWLADPQVRGKLVDIMGLPTELLRNKLNSLKSSSGVPCQLCFCYVPPPSLSCFPDKNNRILWKSIASKNKLPFFDMTDDLIATRYTYYPVSELENTDHFSVNGHSFFAQLLAYELIKNKIVPLKSAVAR